MKIEIYKSSDRQWNIRFRANNGNILLAGRGWNRRASAQKTLGSVMLAIKTGKLKIVVQ